MKTGENEVSFHPCLEDLVLDFIKRRLPSVYNLFWVRKEASIGLGTEDDVVAENINFRNPTRGFGEMCSNCRGSGSVSEPLGTILCATGISFTENTTAQCPVCTGRGVVDKEPVVIGEFHA